MSTENDLLTVCRRYVESRDEVARLKAERRACICDFQGPSGDISDPDPFLDWADEEEPKPARTREDGSREPCWKFIPGEPDDHDYHSTTGVRVRIQGSDDSRFGDHTIEGWCEPCKRRQEVHALIKLAQRRKAARLGAVISMTRGIR